MTIRAATSADDGFILGLTLTSGHERRGLAQQLLAHSEAFAREHGCVRLTLGVFPGNQRARELYARCGFEPDMPRLGRRL